MAKSTKSKVKKSPKASKSLKNPSAKASQPSQKPTRKPSKPVKDVAGAVKSPKTAKPATATPKPSQSKTPQFQSPHGRADGNPFREGSAYAVAWDCLAHSGANGISKGQLVMEVASATGKDERHAGFDVAVLLSAKESGERHQSCRPGFWVERTNDFLKLHVTGTAPAPAPVK